MQRLLAFFTTYTFGLSLLSRVVQFPDVALDILRGAVWIVVIGLVYVYLRYGLKPIQGFYARLGLNPRWTPIYDTLVHLAPLVLVGGLPKTPVGYLGGYGVFLGWYLIVRATVGMPQLYLPEISVRDYDLLVGVVIPLVLGGMVGLSLQIGMEP